jgi:hypothetical protein
MSSRLDVLNAFEKWWKTQPEPHISAPRECHVGMQQERMLAIWLSAWYAAKNDEAHHEAR